MTIPEIIAAHKGTGLPPTAEAFAALAALQAELSALRAEVQEHDEFRMFMTGELARTPLHASDDVA